MKNILVATDFTELSERAYRYASKLAAEMGANILLVHVVEPIEADEEADAETNAFHQQLLDRARQRLEATTSGQAKVSWEARLGHRAQTLLAMAAEREADLIVLGCPTIRTSKTPWAGTSQRLLWQAELPVLMVP